MPPSLRILARRITGCAAVSATATVVSQVLLAVLATLWPPVLANVAVVTATSVPAYAANRRFVWRVPHRRAAAARFVATSLAGLVLSTMAVTAAVGLWHTHWAANLASLGAWAALWPVTFLVNDRLVFRR